MFRSCSCIDRGRQEPSTELLIADAKDEVLSTAFSAAAMSRPRLPPMPNAGFCRCDALLWNHPPEGATQGEGYGLP